MNNKIKSASLSQRAKKALSAALLAGGLIGGQAAQAAIPAASATIPDRVAAVRDAMNKRIAEAKETGGTQAIEKPYSQLEVASWLNWINWPNWNNWGDWNNWANWSNWRNWINY